MDTQHAGTYPIYLFYLCLEHKIGRDEVVNEILISNDAAAAVMTGP